MSSVRHQSTGRWKLGLTLALLTCGFWATLPVALKISLEVLDPVTLTWFRFLCAAVFTAALLALRPQSRSFKGLGGARWGLLALAGLGLLGNYLLYLLGLKFTSPANAQLLIQAAPLLMALGGIYWFRESISLGQVAGFACILFGLGAFFMDQHQRAGSPDYHWGAGLILLGALSWAIYALLQKQLLTRLSSQQIMFVMYCFSALALLPWAQLGTLWHMPIDLAHGLALAYCAINTIGAYGAFAEAMEHWEASRVSAVLATTPILTLLTVAVMAPAFPQYLQPEQLSWLGYFGAACVVGGSILASLARRTNSG